MLSLQSERLVRNEGKIGYGTKHTEVEQINDYGSGKQDK